MSTGRGAEIRQAAGKILPRADRIGGIFFIGRGIAFATVDKMMVMPSPEATVRRPKSVCILLDCGTKGQNVVCGTLKTYMYAGSIATYTVAIGERKMIIDQYTPRDAQRFQHADKVEVEIPRSVHLRKKKKDSSG
jgi:hypothetical protein